MAMLSPLGGAVKLTEAQFAGPFEYTRKPLFTAPVTETLYCTSVIENLPYWPFPELRAAVIRVEKLDGGFERLSAEIRDRAEPPNAEKLLMEPFPNWTRRARSDENRWDCRAEADASGRAANGADRLSYPPSARQ
jgi:hypothetical protein